MYYVFQTLRMNQNTIVKYIPVTHKKTKKRKPKGEKTENENDRLNIPIITLNAKDLNTPIKRQRL